MAFGTLMALSLGAALPTFVLLWGNMTNAFGQGPEAIVEASRTVLFQFIYLAIGVLFAGWIMISFWMIAGERQAVKCR